MIVPGAGWIAAIMLAFYPPAISYDLQIDKPVLDLLLASALIWCIAPLGNRVSWQRLFSCGIVCGLLALNRENALILLLVLGCWLGFTQAIRRLIRVKRIAVFVAGAVLILLPVAVRNSLLGHGMILTTRSSGQTSISEIAPVLTGFIIRFGLDAAMQNSSVPTQRNLRRPAPAERCRPAKSQPTGHAARCTISPPTPRSPQNCSPGNSR